MCIRSVIHIRELIHIIRGTDVLDKARSHRDLALSNTIFYTFTNTCLNKSVVNKSSISFAISAEVIKVPISMFPSWPW